MYNIIIMSCVIQYVCVKYSMSMYVLQYMYVFDCVFEGGSHVTKCY